MGFISKIGMKRPVFSNGLYEYTVNDGAGFKNRIHLRVDEDGTGVLWVNANEAFYLNETGSLFSWMLINKKTDAECEKTIREMIKDQPENALSDFKNFAPKIRSLMDGANSACDLCQSGISKIEPFSQTPSAPYRVDLALTYGCNNHCAHCYNEKDRNASPMSTPKWKKTLDILKKNGIPHVVFTGGEPTLMPNLPELIHYAEDLGLVTGLNTNGRRLSDMSFTQQLENCKLDHIQITLESDEADVHDAMVGVRGAWAETTQGIKNALKTGVFTMTNTTLLKENATPEKVRKHLNFLALIGVQTVGLNALIHSGLGKNNSSEISYSELSEIMEIAKDCCAQNGQKLIWYTPTPYCLFDPVGQGVGIKSCVAARYNMCIEPDGAVLPCQSWYTSVGNILNQNWQQIWNAELCQKLRRREMQPIICNKCDSALLCGGGCPLMDERNLSLKPRLEIPEWA